MASKVTGQQTIVLVETGEEFDPSMGWVQVQVWRGSKTVCAAKLAALAALQWKCTMRKWSGPGYEVVAQLALSSGSTPETETPVDRWKIVTEMVQLDIRNNPKVIAAAVASDTLALWIKHIDAALTEGLSLTDYFASIGIVGAIDPAEEQLYNLKAMGADSHEIHRPVLSRVRTMSLTYVDQFDMDAVSKIYTTTALDIHFDVPAAIMARLPSDPIVSPLNTQWGWKLRQQESDILLATNRIEEIHSWTFAAWSTLLYDVISS